MKNHVLIDQTPLLQAMFKNKKFDSGNGINYDFVDTENLFDHKWLMVTVNFIQILKEKKESVLESLYVIWWGVKWKEGKPFENNKVLREIVNKILE